LQVGYIATHSPYANQEPDLVRLYDDATFSDIPPYRPHPWHMNEGFVCGGQFQQSDLTSRYANYYAAVTDIDRNVGRIIDHLQQQGKLENTLVIYTSDHGCALGHQGFWGKGNSTRPLNMYETSILIPLLVRHPQDVQPGQLIRHCVDHYDTFQMICDYTGADLSGPRFVDRNYPGRSYLPMLQGNPVADWRETRYGEYGDLRMIRTPDWKLVRRYPAGPDDLFDLQHDPGETANLAELPEYQELRLRLLLELEEWYRQHEDPAKQGLRVKELRRHSRKSEAWRDGIREARGLQIY
jgi:arylsulfatase A-like enzyme